MKIVLNGQTIETSATSLEDLVSEQKFNPTSPIATAVNGVFVAKIKRANINLSENDSVEIVAPMQGG